MFEVVADIAVLVARQDAIDKVWADKLDGFSTSHPETDITDIIPSVLDRFSHGEKCVTCGCPAISVESISQRDTVRICRDVLDAMKQASLIHRVSTEICYRCKIKRSASGIVAGAIHLTMGIEDRTVTEDGVTTVILGMKSRIALGKVYHDADTGEVRIDD